LLATVALCVATTVIIKMHKTRYASITLLPLGWLVAVTYTAAWHKIFDASSRIGFLAQARSLEVGTPTATTARLIVNNRLDAAVTATLVVLVSLVLFESIVAWVGFVRGSRAVFLKESPFVRTRLATEEQ